MPEDIFLLQHNASMVCIAYTCLLTLLCPCLSPQARREEGVGVAHAKRTWRLPPSALMASLCCPLSCHPSWCRCVADGSWICLCFSFWPSLNFNLLCICLDSLPVHAQPMQLKQPTFCQLSLSLFWTCCTLSLSLQQPEASCTAANWHVSTNALSRPCPSLSHFILLGEPPVQPLKLVEIWALRSLALAFCGIYMHIMLMQAKKKTCLPPM